MNTTSHIEIFARVIFFSGGEELEGPFDTEAAAKRWLTRRGRQLQGEGKAAGTDYRTVIWRNVVITAIDRAEGGGK